MVFKFLLFFAYVSYTLNLFKLFLGIRDMMMIRDSNMDPIEAKNHKIFKKMEEMEKAWVTKQKVIWDEVLKEHEQIRQLEAVRKEKLLNNCINHGGPFSSITALMISLEKEEKEEKKKKILRTEILYSKKNNFNHHLEYGVNKKTVEELISTLSILINYESRVEEPTVPEIDPSEVILSFLNKI